MFAVLNSLKINSDGNKRTYKGRTTTYECAVG